MKTRVQKWGNNLALRIPKAFAIEARLDENTPIELSLASGKLVIQAIDSEPLSLAELMLRATTANLHSEWESGPATGKEIW